MTPARQRRHVWHERDYCVVCGVVRRGYQGGRTGALHYIHRTGQITARAGECPGPAPVDVKVQEKP